MNRIDMIKEHKKELFVLYILYIWSRNEKDLLIRWTRQGKEKSFWQDSQDLRDRETNMEYRELTEKIIACAFTVYNQMQYGYLESVYEKCMLIELKKAGLSAESQKPISVFYENQTVGDFVADMIINRAVILELKSVSRIIKVHEIQLVNYLTATRLPVGLILNFGPNRVEVKRKVRELPGPNQAEEEI